MKSIIKTVTIGGKDVDLAYTAWAMVDINRLLRQEDGTALELPKVILGDDPGTFELFCSIVEVLAYSAAMYKKLRGQDTDGVVNVKEIMYTMVPTELISARQRAMEAVLSGLGREEDSEIDLGLAELEKKNPRRRQKY